MRKYSWMIMCVATYILSACAGSQKEREASREAFMQDSIRRTEPQRMQVSETTAEVTFRGKKYESVVVRRPDDSLPLVTNSQGERFVDNRITLTLTHKGKTILHRVFTKESFATLVDAKFMKYAILEGVVLDEPSDQGVVYAASVGYPQSDLYVPLRITVSADGKVSMDKEELMEDWHEPGKP